MDPQQRHMLEVTYEAFQDAGKIMVSRCRTGENKRTKTLNMATLATHALFCRPSLEHYVEHT